MTTTATDAGAELVLDRSRRPYAPSWIDHFTIWIDRLPGSVWSYYIGLALLLILAPSAILWIDGSLPAGTFLPTLVFLAIVIAFFLALFRYFDKRAGAALQTLRCQYSRRVMNSDRSSTTDSPICLRFPLCWQASLCSSLSFLLNPLVKFIDSKA